MADALRKHRKVSKKSKKSWRKNTDIADVEEHLEEVRHDDRTGGAVERKSDDAIFFVDKEVVESKNTLSAAHIKKNDKNDDDDDEEYYVSRKDKMMKKLALDKKEEEEKNKSSGKIKSIWGQEVMVVRDAFLEPVYKKPKVMPSTVGVGKAPLEAVELPHEGSSYNPDFDSHQTLLGKAHSEEFKKLKEREKLNKKVKMVSVEELKKQSQIWLKEMSEGLYENNGTNTASDDGDEHSGEDDDGQQKGDSKKLVNKTVKEKRKVKEKKEQEKKLREEKLLKTNLNDVYRIKKIKKEIGETEKKSLAKQLERREKSERIKTKRLAKEKFEEGNIDVQLSEDLSGSLRQLKPEGNLVKDRFKNLQKRNIIEPRKPVVPKRRYKRKVYVRRSYHTETIKDFKAKR